MNQTELRRKKLLEQTRSLYSDSRAVPAVHPRYRMPYRQLYDDECEMGSGLLGFRTGICVLLFFLYIALEYSGIKAVEIDGMQVCEMIMQNISL